MLDLTTVANDNYYEIRLLDGTELHLKRPTQAMFEYMTQLELINSKDMRESLGFLNNIFTRIINRNIENVEYTTEQVADEYTIQIIVYVIQDYFKF